MRIARDTVASYLQYMQDAFLIEKAQRYDVRGRHYIGTPVKYYFVDVGLRNARLNFRQHDYGHIMENVIYNELRMRGMSVDVGMVEVNCKEDGRSKRKQFEVDFVCNRGSQRYYIQSAYALYDEEKRQLWCRDNNDALRVKASSPGNSYVGTFTWDENYKMMKSTSYTRYVGVWKNSDTDYQWRAYDSQTATNIKGCETSFYKYTDSSSSLTSTTTTIDASGITNTDLHVGNTAGQLTATVKAGETTLTGAAITWSSSNKDVAEVDNNGNVEKYIEPELITVAKAKSDGIVFTSKTKNKNGNQLQMGRHTSTALATMPRKKI